MIDGTEEVMKNPLAELFEEAGHSAISDTALTLCDEVLDAMVWLAEGEFEETSLPYILMKEGYDELRDIREAFADEDPEQWTCLPATTIETARTLATKLKNEELERPATRPTYSPCEECGEPMETNASVHLHCALDMVKEGR